jgi:hypothetical protein
MATKIRLEASAWLSKPVRNWKIGVIPEMYSKALQSANEVIVVAKTIGVSLQIEVTPFEINELHRRQIIMENSTNSMLYEVDELIDNPLTRRISPLVERAYALNPCDLIVQSTDPSRANLSYRLDMLLSEIVSMIDTDLQRDFQEKASALNTDSVSSDFQNILNSALFWQLEYEKAHVINKIKHKVFNDKVRSDWENMSPDERMGYLEEYAKRIGYYMGEGTDLITEVICDPETPLGAVNGYYDENEIEYDRDGKIFLNSGFFNGNSFPIDLIISVVTHEVRHQFQTAIVIDSRRIVSKQDGVRHVLLTVRAPNELVRNWSDFSNYDNPGNEKDPSFFWQHPVEYDANSYTGLCTA